MLREEFAGANKASTSVLSPLERRMARRVVPHIPRWLETYHLTMLTLVWCALIVASGYLAAARDIRWLWGVSVMIVSSSISRTVRVRPFSPRFSPLLTASRSGTGEPVGGGAASTGCPGARWPG